MTNALSEPLDRIRPNENEKRRQILEGARRTFLAQGYEGASMSDIAQEAQVSKGTLYVYFTNKEELFTAVVQDYRRAHGDHIFEGLNLETPLDEGLRDCGRRFISLHLLPEVQATYRVVIAESPKFPALGRNFYTTAPRRGIEQLSAFLAHCAAQGVLDLADPELAATQFLDLCKCGIVMRSQMQVEPVPSPARIDYVVDQAVSLFLKGYGPKEAAPMLNGEYSARASRE